MVEEIAVEFYEMKRAPRFKAALILKYILLAGVLSFLGWVYETMLLLVETGRFSDRGALSLPLCPIYASSLLGLYFLAGTPDRGRGILKGVKGKRLRWGLYFALAFLLPTLAELLFGLLFDRAWGIRLWDYSHIPLNYKGYICLPVSIAWTVLIFLFMKCLFEPIKRRVFVLENHTAAALALLLLAFVGLDMLF